MKNILLLQGPVGPFFRLLSKFLSEKKQSNVHQITFNGGDHLFSNKEISTPYLGGPKEWQEYLTRFITQHAITDIVVFGDCRYYHKIAKKVADQLSVEFWVFEEGYLRPAFITLEREGVNGNSLFSERELEQFTPHPDNEGDKNGLELNRSFSNMAVQACLYYLFKLLFSYKYNEYIHHRPWLDTEETFNWMRSGIRKLKYKAADSGLKRAVPEQLSGKFFLAPLQVSVDSQILYHSPYGSVEEFIGVVVKSFSKHADENDFLVFKHHPMDRGFNNYARYIKKLSYAYDVSGRVLYCHDVHLPTLLKHAKGTITINSTVGISSLHHSTPTKALGRAIYNIEGVTSQKSLDEFWQSPCTPCENKFHTFKQFLRDNNQIPGSFYQRPELTLQAVSSKILNSVS